MSYIKSIRDVLSPYRAELAILISKSEESFERQLSFISSGALALSFVLVEKVIVDVAQSRGKYIIVLGWFLLASSLLINLLSHRIALKCHGLTALEIDATFSLPDDFEGSELPTECYNPQRVNERRKKISKYNNWSIWTLFGGVVLVVIYTSWNLFQPNHYNHPETESAINLSVTPHQIVHSIR